MTGIADNQETFGSHTTLQESYHRLHTSIEIPGGIITYDPHGKLADSRPDYPGLTDLAIGIDHFLDCSIDFDNILVSARDDLHEIDLRFAKDNGLTIRLVASAAFSGDYIFGVVAPMFVDRSSAVSDGHRLVIMRCDDQEPKTGTLPYLSYHVVRPDGPRTDTSHNRAKASLAVEVFVGFERTGTVTFSDFDEVRSGYASATYNYIIGRMGLDKLWPLAKRPELSIILLETIRRQFSGSRQHNGKIGYEHA